MSSPDQFDLQVIVASGAEALERASVGLAFALAAACSGDEVVVFLTARAAAFTDPAAGHECAAGFASIADHLRLLMEVGVRVEGCTSCVENYSSAQRCADGSRLMREGVALAGLSLAAIRSSRTRTVTF